MTRRDVVKAYAEQINLPPVELIEAIVVIFCDKATNQDSIVEQQVGRYLGTQHGPVADYVYQHCVERLLPKMGENACA